MFVVAHRGQHDLALAVDHEVPRDVVRSVAVVDGACGVESHREGVARLFAERLHGLAFLAARYGQEDELLAGEAVDDVRLHAGQLLPAGRTPRGPEVEQHDFALQVAERHGAAVDHLDREVRSRVSGLYERCRFGVRLGALLGVAVAARGQQQDDGDDRGDQRQHHPQRFVAFLGCHSLTVLPAFRSSPRHPSAGKLEKLKEEFPGISTTLSNTEAATGADVVILAVKPWFVESVMRELKLKSKQTLVSVAAGISFEELAHFVIAPEMPMFRLIPNTAISELESMTLIAARNTNDEQNQFMLRLFNEMGMAMLIPEDKIAATTALTSCGIAYVLKYIQAAMQAGIEMGIRPKDAMEMVAQSVKGAAALILNNDTHPSVEIDKVTTPGGITIKGINELEHNGFTSAVIKAMKASK